MILILKSVNLLAETSHLSKDQIFNMASQASVTIVTNKIRNQGKKNWLASIFSKDIKDTYIGSGFLVGNNKILTALHVVDEHLPNKLYCSLNAANNKLNSYVLESAQRYSEVMKFKWKCRIVETLPELDLAILEYIDESALNEVKHEKLRLAENQIKVTES